MSQENIEIVRRVYDAAARRDTATVLDLYDPEVEWDVTRSPMARLVGEGRYQGHDGLRRFFRAYHEAWERMEYDYDELIEAGDRVIGISHDRGRGRASGAEVEFTQYAVWTIREGKIVQAVWFRTREEALAAAGLRE